MRFLIDGYNLIFTAGIGGTDDSPGALQRARTMMLQDVREHLTTDEAESTTVVFDAKHAPAGLPDELEQHGIRVLFARNHDEADDLIEELIRRHSSPRRLTIVTSDLRLRQAAARRRAHSLSIDEWLDFLEARENRRRRNRQARPDDSHSPPECMRDNEPLSTDQIEAWMNEFDVSNAKERTPTNSAHPSSQDDIPPPRTTDEPKRSKSDFDWGPFPPGYGEDLL